MTESELLDYINSKIKQNGKRAITGDVLNLALRSLLELIDGGTIVDWGDIEGTLSDQTDLQTALNSKENNLGFTPENADNKKTSLTENSDTFYPTQKAVNNSLDLKLNLSDYSPAHSVLAQQSGTGSPSSVTIETNQILGRLSGGGSNIKGLSVSEVSNLLNLHNKVDITLSTSGLLIDFQQHKIFNSPTSPATGNITEDLTNSKIGIVQKIYHNDSVVPTFPAGWVRLGTKTYQASTLNIIFAEWVDGTMVEYWITQPG
jgi:hypothetical protein